MKLVSLLPIASLASLGLVAATDVPFTSTSPAWKANFKTTGGEIQFCPTGDCATKAFSVKITKVVEYTPATGGGNDTPVKTISDFTLASPTDWTALAATPASPATAVGQKSTFVLPLKQASGDANPTGTLTLTATAYTTASTVKYAGATLSIPVSSVKFTAGLAGWDPDAGNKLKVEMTITSTAKAADGTTQAALSLGSTAKADTISKVVTIGDGMFLDVATMAAVGSAADTVAVTPSIDGAKVVLVFDNFSGKTPLTYDPVMYYTAPSSGGDTPAATTAAPSSTPAPSGASSVWGYAASVFVGAAGLAALMF